MTTSISRNDIRIVADFCNDALTYKEKNIASVANQILQVWCSTYYMRDSASQLGGLFRFRDPKYKEENG